MVSKKKKHPKKRGLQDGRCDRPHHLSPSREAVPARPTREAERVSMLAEPAPHMRRLPERERRRGENHRPALG